VDAGGVPAEWSLAPGSDPTKVLMFLHGGGYCSGSITSHRGMVTRMGRAAGVRTLALNYRLAPAHGHPRRLRLPARAGHRVEQHCDRWRQRRRRAHARHDVEPARPRQAAAGLRLAGVAMDGPRDDRREPHGQGRCRSADPEGYLDELASAYLAGADPKAPMVSPLYPDLTGLPPILAQVGSAETLLDDAVRIVRRAGAADVPVSLEVWPHMIHAWHLWAAQLEDARRAIASAGAFMRAQM
jgi:acetyl esterase/lipase